MSDRHRLSRPYGWDSEEHEVQRTRIAPGKRTLTSALPGRSTGLAHALVQRREESGRELSPTESGADDSARSGVTNATDHWMGAALRPDMFEAPVQRKASDEHTRGSEDQILPSDSAGRAMPDEVRARMEQSMGADFSGVRIHEGPSARAMGAHAYTTGMDIHFASGQYQPNSPGGQELLGHELAHVVQQSRGRVPATTQAKGVAINDDHGLEREADEMGARAARGEPASSSAAMRSISADAATVQRKVVQRQEEDDDDAESPVEQVRTALEDDDADAAIGHMQGLSAEQAGEVLRRFQHEAVSCFDNDSMARAARVLVGRGGPLNRALEWQLDEGTSSDDILATVRACTNDAHKREVRTASWKERFGDELGNDEMAQLVGLLGGDLAFQLDWMDYEGTDWEAIKSKIQACSNDAEKAALRNDRWKVRFCDDIDLGNDEVAELVDLLGGTLRFKFGWMLYEGTDLDALRTRARAAGAADRQTVWSDAAFMTQLHDELGEQDYLDLVVALEEFQPGTTAEDGATHTSAADADAAVQTHLAAYVADAVREGRQISGLVAVVSGDDWDRAGIAHYGESVWNGGKSTSINGFVDSEGRVWIEKDSGNAGTMIHEAVHKYSVDELIGISQPLNEGVTEYFTRVVCAALAPPITGRGNYQPNYDCVVDLVALVGEATVASAYFDGDTDGLEAAFVAAKSDGEWDDFIEHTENNRWADAAALCVP